MFGEGTLKQAIDKRITLQKEKDLRSLISTTAVQEGGFKANVHTHSDTVTVGIRCEGWQMIELKLRSFLLLWYGEACLKVLVLVW
jgi:hypothetical protein